MKFYTGWQWLLIDAANQWGYDKLTFEERIQFTLDHLHELEAMAKGAEKEPLYRKAVMAIRKAQAGLPTGHMIGVDGVCSGLQMFAVLTGCVDGARATGLVDPDRRADAYTECTSIMNEILGSALQVPRKDAKQALMTSYYGSKKTPKDIFGEDTPELNAFYQAAQQLSPGAWELLQDLLGAWQANALAHAWKMPDGYDVRVKVMTKKEARIEVDELDHATFTYEFYENEGQKKGISLPANVAHSLDAYVLRCMHRRCNYDRDAVALAAYRIKNILGMRDMQHPEAHMPITNEHIDYYVRQYERSGIVDIVILPHLDGDALKCLSNDHLRGLQRIFNDMLQYKPFELVSIHDQFNAHANNINWVRYQYKEILADIADSNLLDDILSQINGVQCRFKKFSTNLGAIIRNSNYGLT